MTESDPPKPQLLISCQSAEEVQIARSADVDIIDLKSPASGPMGRVSDETLAAVRQSIDPENTPRLSMALGEIVEWFAEGAFAPPLPVDVLNGLAFTKIALAHAPKDWPAKLLSLRGSLNEVDEALILIPVIYADHEAADAPPPPAILNWAIAQQAPGVLIDTFNKQDGKTVFDFLSEDELSAMSGALHQAGLFMALAGGLALTDNECERLKLIKPDIIGVRGAACIDGRDSKISQDAIAELKRQRAEHLSCDENAAP